MQTSALSLVLLASLGAAAQATLLRASTGPDVADKVATESLENIQIHDGFVAQQKKDEDAIKQVKADKDLSALLQVGSRTTPDSDIAKKVTIESRENLQIHDGFAEQQKLDEEKEKHIKANKNLSALQLRGKNAPESDIASKVKIESMENLQIHDGFLEQQKVDEANEKKVKANKDLSALQISSKTAPSSDVARQVAIDSMENLQIHDGFVKQQKVDEEKQKNIKGSSIGSGKHVHSFNGLVCRE